MATIGIFKKLGREYQGEIASLAVQAKNVRIIENDEQLSDKAPTHRVYVGRAEIGAGWRKVSNEGREYISIKLDDPSFPVSIYASLFDEPDGKGATLAWSRGRKLTAE